MSATNRGAERRPHDNYPTPEWATHRFLDRAISREIPTTGILLEPCAGDGAIIKAFESHAAVGAHHDRRVWTACELRMECLRPLTALARKTFIGDYVARAQRLFEEGLRFDAVVSNPPFDIAEAIVRASLLLSDYVVMLLRINFLGSEERATAFYRDVGVPDLYVLPNRPPFAVNKDGKPGTDATEYAWFVWGPGSRGGVRGVHELLDVTPLEVRKAHTKMLREMATAEAGVVSGAV